MRLRQVWMDYFLENWGSFAGVLGVMVSAFGLWYAFKAQRAAKSAEKAANEARQALSRNLSSVDIERAVELINRLKELHRQGSWNQAVWVYQILRRTLSEIRASMPAEANLKQFREVIADGILRVTDMGNQVNRAMRQNGEPEDVPGFDEILNTLQQNLETLQSNMMYSDDSGGG